MSVREKLKLRFEKLEKMMTSNEHLSNKSEVIETVESISKFWRILNEEERDYINVARWAIEDDKEWK
jgi:hypothetical protein